MTVGQYMLGIPQGYARRSPLVFVMFRDGALMFPVVLGMFVPDYSTDVLDVHDFQRLLLHS